MLDWEVPADPVTQRARFFPASLGPERVAAAAPKL